MDVPKAFLFANLVTAECTGALDRGQIEFPTDGWPVHLTTITTGPGFLGDFVLLLLKTCPLYHEYLFIQYKWLMT